MIFDGSNWEPMKVPNSKLLRSIWGSDGNNVFAVGLEGTVIHYDGLEWSRIENPYDCDINCIWSIGNDNVFLASYYILLNYYWN